jgi:hypothetical protein
VQPCLKSLALSGPDLVPGLYTVTGNGVSDTFAIPVHPDHDSPFQVRGAPRRGGAAAVPRRPSLPRIVCVLALAAALAAAPASARAQDDESLAYEGLVGVGAALVTLVYSPVKVAYATGGLAISGLAWLWTGGDSSVAGPIFLAAVGGDYVVTPSHLDGRRDLHFNGRKR